MIKYKYSTASYNKLFTCHHDLQAIFNKVIKVIDCSIIDGHRDEKTQNNYLDERKSKLQFPDSKHNKDPSMALDAAPYPIDWNDLKRFY